jgi:hypothetical protein
MFIYLCVSISLSLYGQRTKQPEWLMIYWMPYDNNLSNWTDSIFHMMKEVPENVQVVVQADRAGAGGMERYEVNGGRSRFVEQVASDNSASGKEYAAYLEWVAGRYHARRYAVVFLDHGGKLDEVGLDEYPKKSFLRIDSIRMALEKFNQKIGKRVDLLYFQVCAKGAIEPMFEVAGVAEFTLTSQNKLGAPNYYYPGLFRKMKSEIPTNGKELAAWIVENEAPSMYYSQTCIDNAKFPAFEQSWKSFWDSTESVRPDITAMQIVIYDGVFYWDLKLLLENLDTVRSAEVLNALNNLIVFHHVNPQNDLMKEYCGLSILGIKPTSMELFRQYRHLHFFDRFGMEQVIRKLVLVR